MLTPATDCWFLTGPTAAGKTLVSLELAQMIDAEIISMDSMAIYREMDIATAKPSRRHRSVAAHHLIDIVDPDKDYSLSTYYDAALQLIEEIRDRGKQVLFVGGTPLYLKALLRGIFEGPPADWEFRREIEEEVRTVGVAALHQRLELVDPLTAARLHPGDVRRIIRALEVRRATGQPISHLQLQFDEGRSASQCKVFVIQWTREDLLKRIDRRVDHMFEEGLIDEVRRLRNKYSHLSRTASQAVGYRETLDYLDQNLDQNLDLQTTIELVKIRTRRFAKRQRTWFRGLSECRTLLRTEDDHPDEIAQWIVKMAEGGQVAHPLE